LRFFTTNWSMVRAPSSNFVATDVTQVTRENIKDYRSRWEEWIGKKK
jgi:hypothetical protein